MTPQAIADAIAAINASIENPSDHDREKEAMKAAFNLIGIALTDLNRIANALEAIAARSGPVPHPLTPISPAVAGSGG